MHAVLGLCTISNSCSKIARRQSSVLVSATNVLTSRRTFTCINTTGTTMTANICRDAERALTWTEINTGPIVYWHIFTDGQARPAADTVLWGGVLAAATQNVYDTLLLIAPFILMDTKLALYSKKIVRRSCHEWDSTYYIVPCLMMVIFDLLRIKWLMFFFYNI